MSSSIATSYGHVGHSAEVKMHIEIGGETLSVAQLGPDFLILDKAIEHSPADAILFFSIDGNERRRSIRLPDGISTRNRRVAIASR